MYCEHLNYWNKMFGSPSNQLFLPLNKKGKQLKEKKMRKGATHPIIRLVEHPTPIFPLEIKKIVNIFNVKRQNKEDFLLLFLF